MKTTAAIIIALTGFVLAAPVTANDATCLSSDDGEYPCDFTATARDGSFEISADGYPTFALVIERPGVAWVYGTYEAGGRSVALPGPYFRSEEDPACWENPETEASICAW